MRQRILEALLFDELTALVRLRVLAGVSAQPRHHHPQQHDAVSRAHVLYRFVDCLRGLGRPRRICVQELQVAERLKVLRDVSARSLHAGRYAETIPVIFQEEQHRQLARGGDVQRGPEAIRRNRAVTTEHNADASFVTLIP